MLALMLCLDERGVELCGSSPHPSVRLLYHQPVRIVDGALLFCSSNDAQRLSLAASSSNRCFVWSINFMRILYQASFVLLMCRNSRSPHVCSTANSAVFISLCFLAASFVVLSSRETTVISRASILLKLFVLRF